MIRILYILLGLSVCSALSGAEGEARAFYEGASIAPIARPAMPESKFSLKEISWQEDGLLRKGFTINGEFISFRLSTDDLSSLRIGVEGGRVIVHPEFNKESAITIAFYHKDQFLPDLSKSSQFAYWRWIVAVNDNPRFVESTQAPHTGAEPLSPRPSMGGACIVMDYTAHALGNPKSIKHYREALIELKEGILLIRLYSPSETWRDFEPIASNVIGHLIPIE